MNILRVKSDTMLFTVLLKYTFFLSVTTRCSSLYFPCPSALFPRNPGLFSQRMVFRNQDLGAGSTQYNCLALRNASF